MVLVPRCHREYPAPERCKGEREMICRWCLRDLDMMKEEVKHVKGLFEEHLTFHPGCYLKYKHWWTAEEQDRRALQGLK